MSTCTFTEVISKPMDEKYFAEGLAVIESSNVAYQLTYTSGDILTWQLERN